MNNYKVYAVTDSGHPGFSKEIQAASAPEALEIASRMFAEFDIVEVWHHTVLVARIKRSAGQAARDNGSDSSSVT